MDTPSRPTKRLNAEDRKRQILAQASKLIGQHGFKSVSIRDIARAAQVNEALIYRHFSSKDDLLRAIVVNVVKNQPVQITQPCKSLENFHEQLSNFANFYLRVNLADPSFIRTLFYAAMEDYPLPTEFKLNIQDTFLYWLRSSIEKGQVEWGFDPALDPMVAISSFMGGLIFIVLQISVLKQIPPVDPDTYAQSFIHSFFALLKG